MFNIEKMIVAADKSSVSAAITALRNQLAGGGEIQVNQDGTIYNPADPMTNSSLNNGNGFRPVDKAVVAAERSSVADAITALRNQLAGGGEIQVNQDGTIYNPADPMTRSSVNNGNGFRPVDKAVVAATQWYQQDPELQKFEIKAMEDICPDAKWGYLPDGDMYWTVRLRPVVCGQRKDWTLLAVYDSDHPQQRWGGSVRIYPVKPNYSEMVQMVKHSKVTPKQIPHLIEDDDDQLFLCTQDKYNIHAGHEVGEKITTAAACLRFAMRWITIFELGLIDQKTWSMFQEHGKI